MADLSITAANVKMVAGASTKVATAGATITAGQTLYGDANDSSKLKLASTASSAAAAIVGIALHGASADQPITYLYEGDIDIGGTVGIGAVLVASDNPGSIADSGDNTTGDYVTTIGIGITAARVRVKILRSAVAHA